MARKPRGVLYLDELRAAIEKILPPGWFSRFSHHGNAGWTAQKLTHMAVLMSWDDAATLQARFENALDILKQLHPRWSLPKSYSGFIQALQRHTPELRDALVGRLKPCSTDLESYFRVQGWLALAVDGSRFEAPRTIANEISLGCAGNERTGPQIFQTTLQHVGTGLPWDFRLGPGTDSERRHLEDMLPGLPAQSLLLADAGFVSFDLCTWLCANNHFFLMRVGGNIRLLTSLGWEYEVEGQTVYLWSQDRRDKPPLVLRLIEIRVEGRRPVFLLTNVMDAAVFSDKTAAELYRLRWGIELHYRTIKQTFGRRRLLSHSPQAAMLEQTWGVLGLWFLQSLSVSALVAGGQSPRHLSPAKARDIIRRTMRRALKDKRDTAALPLLEQLASAVLDQYKRRGPKQTREYPRKKKQHPPGPPKIQTATMFERKRAKELWSAARLKL